MRITPAIAMLLWAWIPVPGLAQSPPCLPCSGVSISDPLTTASALEAIPSLHEKARLYVRWTHSAVAPWAPAMATALRHAGATPWVTIELTTPSPVLEHLEAFETELEAVAQIARDAGPVTHFEVQWKPAGRDAAVVDVEAYAFVFKRVSVVLSGAAPQARILPQALPPDVEVVGAFYDHDVAAYLDGIAVLAPVDEATVRQLRATIDERDPGRPLVVMGVPLPDPATDAAIDLARHAAAGAALTFFDAAAPTAAELAPLAVLANEFRGDLSFDPYSVPELDDGEAWSFVRGEDLALRVVVRSDSGSTAAELLFADSQLRRPEAIALDSGESSTIFDISRGPDGFRVRFSDPPGALLLSLDRPTAAELEGIEEALTVATERVLPVEEILRRLQAFDDAQGRRLQRYEAISTMHLRFQGAGSYTFEATFEGPFFFQRGEGFDWAWRDLYINGIKWRSKTLPEIPLLQPERAAAVPLEIHFTREYRYRLRGTEEVEGRDCWVVDFQPAEEAGGETGRLFRGTVWIDREHFGRVRTHGLQVGLTGEVISNEETVFYTPVDERGALTSWTPDAFWLPTRVRGQQLFSLLNSTLPVEKETLLTELRLNPDDYADRRQEVMVSDVTMVRDTEEGLKYLVKEEGSGERVVKEGWDQDQLFLLGGLFIDDALDFPLPLLGIDYFSFDVNGSGAQTNILFGGALLVASIARPDLFGTRFDAGLDLFAIAFPFTDEIYRDGEEVTAEAVDVLPASIDLELGRPVGSFFRFGLTYGLDYRNFQRADGTGEQFVLPADHLLHNIVLQGRYSRAGYRLTVAGGYHSRSEWEPWGLPGTEFDPDTKDFVTWEVRLAKNWHLPRFQRLSVEIDYLDGDRLDRFSKYQFGFFGPSRVSGFQTAKVRAESAWLAHLGYGFEIAEIFRLEGVVDAALATDEENGLDNETLVGVGLVGSFVGPWRTLVRLDVGVPVEGPDDGYVASIAFLKLFK